jgi:mediator of RNA polymerase II transcription subunit 14
MRLLFYLSEKGRVHFAVTNLFQTSLSVRGSTRADSWYMVDVEFLINIGGDLTGLQGQAVPPYCM